MPNGVARKKLSDRFFSMSAVKASNTQGCHQQKIEHEMLEKYKKTTHTNTQSQGGPFAGQYPMLQACPPCPNFKRPTTAIYGFCMIQHHYRILEVRPGMVSKSGSYKDCSIWIQAYTIGECHHVFVHSLIEQPVIHVPCSPCSIHNHNRRHRYILYITMSHLLPAFDHTSAADAGTTADSQGVLLAS